MSQYTCPACHKIHRVDAHGNSCAHQINEGRELSALKKEKE